jgi:hypothetical protein
MGVASLVLFCAVTTSGSLWLVESSVDRFDQRLEMRRQSMQGFESLRYRVLQFHDREETALEEERANIDRSYAELLEDWREEPPILGLSPVLRLRDSRLELVLLPTQADSGSERR